MTHIPDDAARHPVRSFAPAGEHWKSLEALDTLEGKCGYNTTCMQRRQAYSLRTILRLN